MKKDMDPTSKFLDVWKRQIAQVGAARKPHQRAQVGRETKSGVSGVQSFWGGWRGGNFQARIRPLSLQNSARPVSSMNE